MADERVHKKTHFAPEAGVQGPAAAAPGRPNSTSPVQENGASLKEQQQRVDVAQQQQPPGAQTLTYPDQKEFAHRRDIYSIHGEQVGTLHCCNNWPRPPPAVLAIVPVATTASLVVVYRSTVQPAIRLHSTAQLPCSNHNPQLLILSVCAGGQAPCYC